MATAESPLESDPSLATGVAGRADASRPFVLVLLYSLAARHVLFLFMLHPGMNGFAAAMFGDLIYGRAHRPFVYRVLLPALVRLTATITPHSVQQAIVNLMVPELFGSMVRRMGWEPAFFFEYLVAALLMFLSLLGLAYALRVLVRTLYAWPGYIADLAPVGGLLLLPLCFRYYSYIYDPPALFLFTLTLCYLVQRRYTLYYLAFILTTLNKETAVLLIPVFLMHEYRFVPSLSLCGHAVAQAALWATWQLFVRRLYHGNPGTDAGYHWTTHTLPTLLNPPLLITLIVLLVALLVGYGWRTKPLFLRRGLIVTLGPLLLLTSVFGFIDELRDYYEAFPFIFLLMLPTVAGALGIPTLAMANQSEAE